MYCVQTMYAHSLSKKHPLTFYTASPVLEVTAGAAGVHQEGTTATLRTPAHKS